MNAFQIVICLCGGILSGVCLIFAAHGVVTSVASVERNPRAPVSKLDMFKFVFGFAFLIPTAFFALMTKLMIGWAA